MIDRSKLFSSLAKKHKLPTSKVQAVYETLIKAKSFTQQEAKAVKVKEQVAVAVKSGKIQKVQVIKEVPVIAYKQVIKTVKVIQEVPVEVIREVKVIKEVPIEVVKEIVREVKVPVIKIKEVIKKVPVIKVKEVVKKVEVIKKVADTKQIDKLNATISSLKAKNKAQAADTREIDKLNASIADLKAKLKVKPKTIEIVREVPVEIIKEVEVVKQIDFASLAKMMKGMKKVEVSKTVIGETSTRGQEKIVERRELKPGTKATKVTGKATKVSTKTKAKSTGKKDDLTKIEGIGPKIAEILNDSGINTFKDLSKAKISSLKATLDKAGPRFQMHDPSTWTEQAALAADGKWNKLKTLQDNLDGGRK